MVLLLLQRMVVMAMLALVDEEILLNDDDDTTKTNVAGCSTRRFTNALNIEYLPIEQKKVSSRMSFELEVMLSVSTALIAAGVVGGVGVIVITTVDTGGSSSSSLLLDHNILGNTRPAGRMRHARDAHPFV